MSCEHGHELWRCLKDGCDHAELWAVTVKRLTPPPAVVYVGDE